MSFHFCLDDNTFLDPRYVKNIKESTPKGMFYDRGINGIWVSGEGVVYPDFDQNVHVITPEQAKQIIFERVFCGVDWGYDRGINGIWVSGEGVVYPDFDQNVHVITPEQAKQIIFERVFCGVDWGWEHWGAIVVIGVKNGSYYIIEEHAAQHKYIKNWIETAKDIIRRYGDIPFYCDPARTEHIAAFQDAGIEAYMANNRVLSGIEAVATLMTNKQFFIVYSKCPRFREEIYKYIWKKNTGEPLKENDDVLCAIRYGIYSDMTVNEIELPGQSQMEQAKKLKGLI